SLARNGVLPDLDVGRYISERYSQGTAGKAQENSDAAAKKAATVKAQPDAKADDEPAAQSSTANDNRVASDAGKFESSITRQEGKSSSSISSAVVAPVKNATSSLAARQF